MEREGQSYTRCLFGFSDGEVHQNLDAICGEKGPGLSLDMAYLRLMSQFVLVRDLQDNVQRGYMESKLIFNSSK